VLKIPIAHNEGNYNCDGATGRCTAKTRQILFRYTNADGSNDDSGNPNGSMNNIAGICNRERNVAGLMPHPERAVNQRWIRRMGLVIFQSMRGGVGRGGEGYSVRKSTKAKGPA